MIIFDPLDVDKLVLGANNRVYYQSEKKPLNSSSAWEVKHKKPIFSDLSSNHGSLDKVIKLFQDKIWTGLRRESQPQTAGTAASRFSSVLNN